MRASAVIHFYGDGFTKPSRRPWGGLQNNRDIGNAEFVPREPCLNPRIGRNSHSCNPIPNQKQDVLRRIPDRYLPLALPSHPVDRMPYVRNSRRRRRDLVGTYKNPRILGDPPSQAPNNGKRCNPQPEHPRCTGKAPRRESKRTEVRTRFRSIYSKIALR